MSTTFSMPKLPRIVPPPPAEPPPPAVATPPSPASPEQAPTPPSNPQPITAPKLNAAPLPLPTTSGSSKGTQPAPLPSAGASTKPSQLGTPLKLPEVGGKPALQTPKPPELKIPAPKGNVPWDTSLLKAPQQFDSSIPLGDPWKKPTPQLTSGPEPGDPWNRAAPQLQAAQQAPAQPATSPIAAPAVVDRLKQYAGTDEFGDMMGGMARGAFPFMAEPIAKTMGLPGMLLMNDLLGGGQNASELFGGPLRDRFKRPQPNAMEPSIQLPLDPRTTPAVGDSTRSAAQVQTEAMAAEAAQGTQAIEAFGRQAPEYAWKEVTDRMGLRPGNKSFDQTRQQMAQRQGTSVDQISEDAVRQKLYSSVRAGTFAQQQGFVPGSQPYEQVRQELGQQRDQWRQKSKQLLNDRMREDGYAGGIQEFTEKAKNVSADPNASEETKQKFAGALAELQDNMDRLEADQGELTEEDVIGYAMHNGKLSGTFNDFTLVNSMRNEQISPFSTRSDVWPASWLTSSGLAAFGPKWMRGPMKRIAPKIMPGVQIADAGIGLHDRITGKVTPEEDSQHVDDLLARYEKLFTLPKEMPSSSSGMSPGAQIAWDKTKQLADVYGIGASSWFNPGGHPMAVGNDLIQKRKQDVQQQEIYKKDREISNSPGGAYRNHIDTWLADPNRTPMQEQQIRSSFEELYNQKIQRGSLISPTVGPDGRPVSDDNRRRWVESEVRKAKAEAIRRQQAQTQ